MAITKERRKEFLAYLQNNSFVKSHLYPCSWTSGSSTEVYSITEWQSDVTLQWNSDKPCQKWIDKVVAKFGDIVRDGVFWKSDGSCPSRITFMYAE